MSMNKKVVIKVAKIIKIPPMVGVRFLFFRWDSGPSERIGWNRFFLFIIATYLRIEKKPIKYEEAKQIKALNHKFLKIRRLVNTGF